MEFKFLGETFQVDQLVFINGDVMVFYFDNGGRKKWVQMSLVEFRQISNWSSK